MFGLQLLKGAHMSDLPVDPEVPEDDAPEGDDKPESD
jgi:hypothetical protein